MQAAQHNPAPIAPPPQLDMVKEWIMTTCIEELLSAPKAKLPPEDSIEVGACATRVAKASNWNGRNGHTKASQTTPTRMHTHMHAHARPQAACEMITTAGGRLAKSERPETRRKLEDVMIRLEKLTAEKNLASRIRFVIKDVLVRARGRACVRGAGGWWGEWVGAEARGARRCAGLTGKAAARYGRAGHSGARRCACARAAWARRTARYAARLLRPRPPLLTPHALPPRPCAPPPAGPAPQQLGAAARGLHGQEAG